MFCQYSYPAAATAADILSDLKAILTRTDNNQPTGLNYTIADWSSTQPSGWELYDDAAGANAKAFRAIHSDGQTYKFIVIDVIGVYVYIKTYESWNSSTHVGTNLCYYSDNSSYLQRTDLTNGGNLFIFASNRYCIMYSRMNNLVYGSSLHGAPCGCVEVSRLDPDDTPGAGYPAFGWFSWGVMHNSTSTGAFPFPRTRSGQTGQNASYAFVSCLLGIGGFNLSGGVGLYQYIPTVKSDWGKHFAQELSVGTIYSTWGKEIKGRLSAIRVMTRNFGNVEDTVVIEGNTYFIAVETTQNGRLAIPKF